ncbi:MAG: TraR/DksA family transcriptional regulator [Planctomycetota bacterium]
MSKERPSKKMSGTNNNSKKSNSKDLDEYRDLLMERRNFLTGAIASIGKSVPAGGADGGTGDSADMGSEAYEQDFSLSLLETESEIVQKIDDALVRIQDGNYGLCFNCEKPILKARLRAIPWTDYCVDCQRSFE